MVRRVPDYVEEGAEAIKDNAANLSVSGVVSSALFTGMAVAQQSGSERAASVCNGTGWGFFIALVLLGSAIGWLIALLALGSAVGMVSIGGFSKHFRDMGMMTMVLTGIGCVSYLIVMTFVGVAYAASPISIPADCVLPI